MFGDVETQPGEGALTLSDLADGMDEGDDEVALAEDEGGEEPELQEEDESEEGGQDAEDEEQQEEPTVTLKHDGKEVTLKQSEVVELAQKGFDYSQKTMAVAEERKVVEQERAKVAETWQQNMAALEQTEDRLQAFVQFMETQVGTPPPIEWAQQDAAYYLAQKQLHEDRKGQLDKALSAVENVRQEAHKAKAYDQIQADKAKLKPKTELKKVQKPSAGITQPRAEAKRTDALKRYKAAPSISTLADLMD
jgi:hypothetical protein